MARDTKLGQEEITRDIPNVGEEALKNLDEAGIVYIGAEVKPGDILVGKVTPKGELPMTPEEKLLRAIFGEKASDVRDTSTAAAAGRQRHDRGSAGVLAPRRRQGRACARHRAGRNRAPGQGPRRREGDPGAQLLLRACKNCWSTRSSPAGRRRSRRIRASPTSCSPRCRRRSGSRSRSRTTSAWPRSKTLKKHYNEAIDALTRRFEDKVDKLQRGDELPPGVMKMVKVFVAVKRKLQPGDKMAGRHGNKGVISTIVPLEDMPYLEDGTSGRHRAEPAGRAVAHERRADPRDPSRAGPAPISAARSARCWTRCARHKAVGSAQAAEGRLWREDLQGRDRRPQRRADDRAVRAT